MTHSLAVRTNTQVTVGQQQYIAYQVGETDGRSLYRAALAGEEVRDSHWQGTVPPAGQVAALAGRVATTRLKGFCPDFKQRAQKNPDFSSIDHLVRDALAAELKVSICTYAPRPGGAPGELRAIHSLPRQGALFESKAILLLQLPGGPGGNNVYQLLVPKSTVI